MSDVQALSSVIAQETITDWVVEPEGSQFTTATGWAAGETQTLEFDSSVIPADMARPENDFSASIKDQYWSVDLTLDSIPFRNSNTYYWTDGEDKNYVAFWCVPTQGDGSGVWVLFGKRNAWKWDELSFNIYGPHEVGFHNGPDDMSDGTHELSVTIKKLYEDVNTPEVRTGSATFRVSSSTEGAELHYTTDGSEPTSESPVFSDGVTIKKNSVVKVVGIKNKLLNSDIASLTVNVKLPTPEASSSVDGDEATISLTNSDVFSDYENVEFKVQINEEEVTTETFPLTVVRNGIYKIQATGSSNVASDQYQFSISDITVDTPVFDIEEEAVIAKVGTARVGSAIVS